MLFSCKTKDGKTEIEDSNQLDFSNVVCNQKQVHSERNTLKDCGARGEGKIYQVGFKVGKQKNQWLNLMDSCYDTSNFAPIWVHHNLSAAVPFRQRGTWTVSFKSTEAIHGTLDLNHFFKRGKQMTVISARDIEIHFKGKTGFSRGHLAPRADYVYHIQQEATYYLLNAAPQWQAFNEGNWKDIEEGLRNASSDYNWNLEIYTGTYGVLEINNAEVYLDNTAHRIPVPKVFYKIVIEPEKKAAIVFITVNDPRFTNTNDIMAICVDITNDVHLNYMKNTWPQNRRNRRLGYSYVCELNDFFHQNPEIKMSLPDKLQQISIRTVLARAKPNHRKHDCLIP